VVPDGALLLDTVRQVHADLLILDIMMPGLNGFEIYDRSATTRRSGRCRSCS